MKKVYLSILLVIVMAPGVFADIPNTLNYQGRLMDSVQQPVVDGQYSVTFRLYAAESGGTMVWEEAQSVVTNNGYFNTVLGNLTALTPSSFNQPLWVGIQVGTNAEMTLRQKLGTSAYAMTVADGAITAQKMAFDATLPVGTIMAWHKSLPNVPQTLPDSWVECNGQTLTGTGGSLDGVVIPNLNILGRFLRGSQTSGVEQEDAFQGHKHKLEYAGSKDEIPTHGSGGYYNDRLASADSAHVSYLRVGVPRSDGSNGTPRTADETRPINMSVVWIIKIK
ncbi:hypothetical protein K8S19_08695 [bacterium]|nr:hypothetical protein [bacterium]